MEPRTLLSYTVTSLADNGSSGTLRSEIAQADTAGGNQTITFDPSLTSSGPATITLAGTALTLNDTSGTLTIDGPGPDHLSVNANGASNVFINDGTAQLDGLTLTGANAYWGGAILEQSATLTVNDCDVIGNSACRGAGILLDNGTLTVSDSTISGNAASSSGGAICSYASNVTITDSTISGNTAGTSGGAMYNYANGTLTVTDSTISGNTGGGVNSTTGIGIYGTIIAENTSGGATDLSGTGFYGTDNLIGDTSGSAAGLSSSDNIFNEDQLLAPLADNGGPTATMALESGSPAIGAGASFADPITSDRILGDQRGQTRTQFSSVDIGAYQTGTNAVGLTSLTALAASTSEIDLSWSLNSRDKKTGRVQY